MKRYIKLFWCGLTGILAFVAEWITVVLGMKDDSKYGIFIRRVVGTSFAIIMVLLAGVGIWGVFECFCEQYNINFRSSSGEYRYSEFVSRGIDFFPGYDGKDGYLADNDGNKILKGINWISRPLGEDSLVVYSDGKKRGYFNMYTGQVVIKPKFAHAWVFSDGLASVDDDGWIKFIDQTGEIVFDPKIPYRQQKDGYVYHNNHCVVHNDHGDRLGLIDKQGKWALRPEYLSIEPTDTFWIISNGKEKSVLTADLHTVLPFMDAKIWIRNGMIEATMPDHTIRTYSLQGELMEDFYISEVTQLMYDTNEVYYYSSKTYDDEGNVSGETEDSEVSTRSDVAHCRRYQAEYNWYGLMTSDGHIITPPSYSDITAIGPDLYLCKTDYEHGCIINGKGQIVK